MPPGARQYWEIKEAIWERSGVGGAGEGNVATFQLPSGMPTWQRQVCCFSLLSQSSACFNGWSRFT